LTSSLDQIHPEDCARVLEAAEKARNTGRGERLEYRIRHKDCSWRFLESTASVIRGLEGESEGLFIVNRDITQRKRARRQFFEAVQLNPRDPVATPLVAQMDELLPSMRKLAAKC
jgi:hypothetical protein